MLAHSPPVLADAGPGWRALLKLLYAEHASFADAEALLPQLG
ncbi:MAG: hypothetical protein ACRDQX_01385 [Pseudonocardiaceae bacterium]